MEKRPESQDKTGFRRGQYESNFWIAHHISATKPMKKKPAPYAVKRKSLRGGK